MKNLKLWYIRTFTVISIEKANDLGLMRLRGVYGDEINHLNCRSIWCDGKVRTYRVAELK